MKKEGLVTNIQKFSLHDGPGIRTTVFMKGCPLKCWWCHNPESINPKREALYNKKLCINCGQCGGMDHFKLHEVMESQCLACPTEALSIIGKEYTPEELMKEILLDKKFYNQSGGGVTFSGGEPLLQDEFLLEVLQMCKASGVHVALDTTGYADWETLEMLLPYVDLFLYDIKFMDSEQHKKYTGVENVRILENLKKLSTQNCNIYVRLPIIGGINDSEEAIADICGYIQHLNIKQINLLPYHNIGKSKYENLQKTYLLDHLSELDTMKMEALKSLVESYDFKTIIGG